MQELKLFRTTRGRMMIAVPATLLLGALWLAYDLSIAILVPASIPIWMPFLSDRDDLSPVARQRLNRALPAVGVLFLVTAVVGVVVFASR